MHIMLIMRVGVILGAQKFLWIVKCKSVCANDKVLSMAIKTFANVEDERGGRAWRR